MSKGVDDTEEEQMSHQESVGAVGELTEAEADCTECTINKAQLIKHIK